MLNFLFDAGWLLVIKPSNFPLMKMSEIHDLSPTELSKKLRELGDELLHLQLRKQTGQVEKPHLIKSLRKDRARILTTLSNQAKQA